MIGKNDANDNAVIDAENNIGLVNSKPNQMISMLCLLGSSSIVSNSCENSGVDLQ